MNLKKSNFPGLPKGKFVQFQKKYILFKLVHLPSLVSLLKIELAIYSSLDGIEFKSQNYFIDEYVKKRNIQSSTIF